MGQHFPELFYESAYVRRIEDDPGFVLVQFDNAELVSHDLIETRPQEFPPSSLGHHSWGYGWTRMREVDFTIYDEGGYNDNATSNT